jgi:hypothetical protein
MPATKVVRTFFADREVDAAVARLAADQGVSKNQAMRDLLERGMADLQDQLELRPAAPESSELDEGEDDSRVLRSVYLRPDFDEQLRRAAFEHRTSKSALMRWFIEEGLKMASNDQPAADFTFGVGEFNEAPVELYLSLTDQQADLDPRMGTSKHERALKKATPSR